ncbi:MAG: hypothetical protein M1813_000887 [Trichoglossum hirsutum]|nr:MAG: hypothetical protein M1813_000887 [Trichoglossum hirsutum]
MDALQDPAVVDLARDNSVTPDPAMGKEAGVPLLNQDPPRQAPAVAPLQLQYAEDSAIIRTASNLNTYIDQSAVNFYDDSNNVNLGGYPPPMLELAHPATRLPGIRQYIARRIIDHIIMARDESSSETITATSASLAIELLPYAIPAANGERESHLHELCVLGAELRTLMSSHPSHWEFGPWDATPGYIMVFPPLLKGREHVASGQSFRI